MVISYVENENDLLYPAKSASLSSQPTGVTVMLQQKLSAEPYSGKALNTSEFINFRPLKY